jgi:hypothetical protein
VRQAIETKYLARADHKGSRIAVRAQAGSMIVPWDDALNPEENHARAAVLYARKRGWITRGIHLHGGANVTGSGYHFVLVNTGAGELDEAHTLGKIARVDAA